MLNGLDLFSGIGGLTIALSPWVRPIAYCENDRYAQAVLLSRMQGGDIPPAPIWDDVRTLRGELVDLVGVDIIYGGFPCQDISTASHGRGKGLRGSRSGLWREMYRLIKEIQPSNVFIENVGRWQAWVPSVRKALDKINYDTLSVEVSAVEVGFPFEGKRVFVAASYRDSKSALPLNEKMEVMCESAKIDWAKWGNAPTRSVGVVNGLPLQMERLRALGNAVVPLQAREAFKRLMGIS